MAPTYPDQDFEIFSFKIRFEGTAQIMIETSAYLYREDGRLIEGADIYMGELRLALTEPELNSGRLFIIPFSTDTFSGPAPELETLRGRYGYELDMIFVPGRRNYVLPEIPETVWRMWLVHRGLTLRRKRFPGVGILIP